MTIQSPSPLQHANCCAMSDIAQEAKINPRLLMDREIGEQALLILKERLGALPDGQPLIVSFGDEQRMDGSFADAAFVNLALEINEGKWGERALLLQGLSDNMVRNIEGAISLRKLKLALLSVSPDGSWKCIGHLESNLSATLEQVAKHDGIGANELASIFNLAINTASNRLKRIHAQHLVRREAQSTERGLQYAYWFWNWRK